LTRLKQFWNATDIAAVQAIVDVRASIASWAAECMLNDGDGYWGGAHNFYLYDQGAKGYVWIPSDVDATFNYLSKHTINPFYWWIGRFMPEPPGQHYAIVMADPTWRAAYVDAMAAKLARFDVAEIQGWIGDWSKQIADAVAQDPHKAATVAQFGAAIAAAKDEVHERAEFVSRWLACERDPADPRTDADGDGVPWCDDCRDDAHDVHPGAAEACNGIDDDCDGFVDEGCPPAADGGAPADDAGTAADGAVTAVDGNTPEGL
jgi:hypothetical protein